MRDINRIIIHCTATPEGRAVSVEEIDKWHKQRGFRMIGYHYVIGLDGVVYEGRKEDQVGAHCSGHNTDSIGVSYVGGLDADMKAKDTRTEAQKSSLEDLVKFLLRKYPNATVHGHNEFSKKACPSFNVANWLKSIGV